LGFTAIEPIDATVVDTIFEPTLSSVEPVVVKVAEAAERICVPPRVTAALPSCRESTSSSAAVRGSQSRDKIYFTVTLYVIAPEVPGTHWKDEPPTVATNLE
jgi:hypothetical protein